MKKTSWPVVALVGAAAVCAAQTTPAPQSTPAPGLSGSSSPNMSSGSGMQLSTGTVTEYKPGQRIAVRISENNVVTLDLDQNVRVDGLVAEGQLAAVMWMGDSGGKRRVTSITAAPGPGDAGTASLASGYQQMEATPGPKGAVTPGSSSRVTPKAGATTPRTTPSGGAPTPTPKP